MVRGMKIWLTSFLGFFFRLAGKEVKAEIQRREAIAKKKRKAVMKAQKELEALNKERKWLDLFAKEQQKIKDLYIEQNLNQKKREDTQAKLDRLLVDVDEVPY
jgi:hypothetical protein